MSSLINFKFDPSGQYLFRRAYAVSLAPPNTIAAIQYGTIGPRPAPLRVRFEVDKNTLGSPAKAKIELYNLSQQTRKSLKSGWGVLLQAGYSGGQLNPTPLIGTIFFGDINIDGSKDVRDNAEIITSMECGDGEAAIIYSRIDKSYPAGTTLQQVINDISAQLMLQTNTSPFGVGKGVMQIPSGVVFARGLVLHETCKDALDKLLEPQGLKWSVDSANLNIFPIGGNNGSSAIVVSAATGMIGVPSQNKNLMTFTSLLNPKIAPGTLIQLVSENTALNGFYNVNRAKYEGDSHDNKWQVYCECTQNFNIAQNLPASGSTGLGGSATVA